MWQKLRRKYGDMKPATRYLDETIAIRNAIEISFLVLAERLHKIHTDSLWQDRYSTYREFLDEIRIKPATDSILRKVYETYVLEHKFPRETLGQAGYSTLYAAIPLLERESADSVLNKTLTLTRSEIEDEIRERKHGVHECTLGEERWAACTSCGKFQRV